MDSRCDVAGLPVNLCGQVCGGKPIFTAALSKLALDVVSSLHDCGVGSGLRQSHFLAELADVALHIIPEIADAVSDVGQPVVDLSKLLAEQDFLLAGSCGVLTEIALPVEAVPAARSERE